MAIRYYHRDGTPGEFLEVAAEWEAGHTLASDEVGKYWVSTIWLFVDHAWGQGDPVLYESMVFKGDDMSDLECRRYTTIPDALAGHAELVEELRLLAGLAAGEPAVEDHAEQEEAPDHGAHPAEGH